jgi:hypothetical protein
MPRRPAMITQADVRRVIRAARQEGAREVEVRVGDKAAIVIRLGASSTEDCNSALAPRTEIVL